MLNWTVEVSLKTFGLLSRTEEPHQTGPGGHRNLTLDSQRVEDSQTSIRVPLGPRGLVSAGATPKKRTQTSSRGGNTFLSFSVYEVFENVAQRYDVMNDAMSLGIHRLWKDALLHVMNPQPGARLLDVAGGTGRALSQGAGLKPLAALRPVLLLPRR